MKFTAVPNPGNKPGSIQVTDDGLHKVTFIHAGSPHILGLFGSLDESHRVCDVLAIKAAVDAGRDLASLNLHCDLHRYGVDLATAGEIRSVSFRQVVRDLQACCTRPLAPLAAETTSWAAAAMSMSGLQEPGRAAAAVTSRALRQPAPSIARAAFHQAGAANAAAAHLTSVIEEGAVDMGGGSWRVQEDEEVSGGVSQQQQQQQQQQEQADGDLPSRHPDQHAALSEHSADQSAGLSPHDAAAQPDRASDGLPGDAPARGGSRKRRQRDGGSDAEVEQQEGGAAQGRRARRVMTTAGANALQAGPRSSGPAAGAAAGPGSVDRPGEAAAVSEPDGELGKGADALAFTAADHPFHGITVPTGGSKAFAQLAIKHNGTTLSRGGRHVKNLRFAACATPAEAAAAWDLGAIWRAIQYGEEPSALDEAKRLSERLNFGFSRYSPLLPTLWQCGTLHALQAAVNALRDDGGLARLASGSWRSPGSPQQRDSQAGGASPVLSRSAGAAPAAAQPEAEQDGQSAGAHAQEGGAAMEVEEEQQQAGQAMQRKRRGAAPRPRQRQQVAASEEEQEQGGAAPPAQQRQREERSEEEQGEELRQQSSEDDQGELPQQEQQAGRLPAAQQGQQPAADAAPASAAAPQRRGRQGGRRRAPGAARGVSGTGPWRAQVALQQAKVLPSKARLWESMRADAKLVVPNCLSHAAAAACADLLLLWRCQMYGDDPEEADLNLPLERYRNLLPALDTLGSAALVLHVQRLRDRGALNSVLLPAHEVGEEHATVQSPDAAAAAVPAFLADVRWGDSLHARMPGSNGDRDAARQAAAAGGRLEQQQQQLGAQLMGLALPLSRQPHQQPQRQRHGPAATAHGEAGGAAPLRRPRLSVMGSAELRQAMYARCEQERVEAQQEAYEEVESMLAGLQPDISENQVTAYMAQFLLTRDLRSLLYSRLTAWHKAGRRDLLLCHVRAALPHEQGGEREGSRLQGLHD